MESNRNENDAEIIFFSKVFILASCIGPDASLLMFLCMTRTAHYSILSSVWSFYIVSLRLSWQDSLLSTWHGLVAKLIACSKFVFQRLKSTLKCTVFDSPCPASSLFWPSRLRSCCLSLPAAGWSTQWSRPHMYHSRRPANATIKINIVSTHIGTKLNCHH